MRYVSATQLAKLAKCERQLYLESQYGECTQLTDKYIKRGNDEHERFRQRLSSAKGNWLIRLVRWLLRLLFK